MYIIFGYLTHHKMKIKWDYKRNCCIVFIVIDVQWQKGRRKQVNTHNDVEY